jgi:hypothetical protein
MNGVSLQGVMKLLFAADDEPEIDLSQERWSADEPEKYDSIGEPENDPENTPKPPPSPRSDAEALAVLRDQIDHFLFELAKPSFCRGMPGLDFGAGPRVSHFARDQRKRGRMAAGRSARVGGQGSVARPWAAPHDLSRSGS